jgi:cation diffusion facilitator CzcD-associated flavoprotein CzcO
LDSDTVIVGAGPYGLSIAAHLRAAKRPFEIFGNALESWRTFMPEGMILKSERFASNLWDPARHFTLRRYCGVHRVPYQSVGSPLSLELFLQYADWFRREAVGEIQNAKVVGLTSRGRGFELTFSDGSHLTSRRVVLATGHMAFRTLPVQLSALPEPLVVHSTRMGPVKAYAGCDVTIIGAGQSALEIAALLHEARARVRLLARISRVEWNAPSRPRPLPQRILAPDAGVASGWRSLAVSELPRVFRWYFPAVKRHRFVKGSYGPSGAWWLRDRVDGRIETWLDTQLESAAAVDGGVSLRVRRAGTPHEIRTDHVIAATGFEIDIDRLEYLDPTLRTGIARETGGIPALSSNFESSIPGLFIVGVASSPVFGPIMRFMYGAKHVAPALARRLKKGS